MTRLPVALLFVIACAGTAAALANARPAAAPPFAAAQPVLGLGSRGVVVADWQEVLKQWMRDVGTDAHLPRAEVLLHRRLGSSLRVDGVFGPITEAATKQWQRDFRLRSTGLVTWRAWLAWIGSNVTCCGAGYPNLASGIRGLSNPAVGWWQVALDRWLVLRKNRPTVVIDLRYDAVTYSATKLFQRSVGLRATGMADRATWLRMSKIPNALQL